MSTLHVICKIGDADYAIPADEVQQMESFTSATPVPGASDYVTGLVQVRQQIIAVIDGRVRFGLPKKSPSLESRVVVLGIEGRSVGVLVDSAREVQHIAPEQMQPPPEVVAAQSAGFVKAVAQLKERIVMLLDTAKVISEGVANA